MTTRSMSQCYVCQLAFPGKKPLWFGTVVCDAQAPHHEVEAACREKVSEHLPDGWQLVKVCPGAIWLKTTDEGWNVP